MLRCLDAYIAALQPAPDRCVMEEPSGWNGAERLLSPSLAAHDLAKDEVVAEINKAVTEKADDLHR